MTYEAGESAKFDVKTDLLEVGKDMRKRNVPTFADGYYRCIVDPTAMMHLRQNSDFREIARYPGTGMIIPWLLKCIPMQTSSRVWVLLTDKLALWLVTRYADWLPV